MELIAAIATGNRPTAIGILRLSGEGCFAACDRVFRPRNGKAFSEQRSHTMVLGRFLDAEGRVLDEGLAVRFPAGSSYTGEESAELHCHGSPVVLRELLEALFAAGARQAGPGEFTRRAFLNGRLDLTAAEAVIDLIDAETAAAARNAARQLGGSLLRTLQPVQDALLDITSRFYAVVDYPDEDIEDIRPEEITAALRSSGETLSRLLATARRGSILRSGVKTAIVGRPNAGKSSLLNALVGYDRAIVTEIPGTTRDTVEEKCVVGGVLLRLTDTAGIRETGDAVERLGVERSLRAMEEAELTLAVADASVPLTEEDMAVLLSAARRKNWILVWSKKDLTPPDAPLDFPLPLSTEYHAPAAAVQVCAPDGTGIAELESAIAALFPAGEESDSSLLTNARQTDAVLRARDAILRAEQALSDGLTPDAVLTDAEEALDALGELTGRSAREDIVSTIFARFCVGK